MGMADHKVDRPSLAPRLRSRHVSMIALGGTIGAGILINSGDGITSAGPAIVISYLVVGVLAVIVMRVLGIQTRRNPDSGSFATHAGEAFGRPGRFAVGWMYWWLMAVTASVEASTAGAKAAALIGVLPAQVWSLLVIVTLTAVNLAPVGTFGEFQFWLVSIKVVVVFAVPLLAVLGVLGVIPNVSTYAAASAVNTTGMMPNGFGPVVAVMLGVAFSFIGIEMTSIAAGETDRPRRVIPRAVSTVMCIVLGSYVLAMVLTVILVPWNDSKVAAGPFAAMMTALHISAATTIADIVELIAVLSVFSSCVYAASRIGFSLAARQDAPKPWGRLSARQVPRNAVLSAALVATVITGISYLAPHNISAALIASSGAAGFITWIGVVVAFLKLRPSRGPGVLAFGRATVFMAALAGVVLVFMLIGMVFLPATQLQLIMTLLVGAVIFVVILWRETNSDLERVD
jgi:GABA permease